MKRLLSLLFVLLMTVALLSACGAESAPGGMAYDENSKSEIGEALPQETVSAASGTNGSAPSQLPESSKLIRKLWLNAETDDLDALLQQVDQRITELGGYVENRQVYNGSNRQNYRSRSAEITVRIPAQKMGDFAQTVSENANVTSSNETTENITLTYVATESRMKALETEQTRLLELLAKAESMEDLLKIEKRLTEVRTELERVASQLRVYDNQVNYSTIYLDIAEVKEYTVVEEPETVWERMGNGFMTSLKNLGKFITELFVFIVSALPWLIPLGLIIGGILFLNRRRRKKNTPPTPRGQSES